MFNDLGKILELNNCFCTYHINHFNNAQLIHTFSAKMPQAGTHEMSVNANNCKWRVRCQHTMETEGILDLRFVFKLEQGNSKETNIGVSFEFNNWSKEHYVLLPSAAYNGNRFQSKKLQYPPQLFEKEDLGLHVPTIISDVPRLNIEEGYSEIQQLTRDLATPAIGFCGKDQQGFILLTKQKTALGDSGISIKENSDRSKATITVNAPGVRHDKRYTICNTDYPCEDRGASFKEGDSIALEMQLCFFKCSDIVSLFNAFSAVRKNMTGEVKVINTIPFSYAWSLQEEKYNNQNWEEQLGYYSVGMRENLYQDWQIGWVGGLMSTYPLFFEGNALSKERALKTFEFVFKGGQDQSGLFYGCGHEGKWYGDNFKNPDLKWHLIRKSADALYFITKQFSLICQQEPAFLIPEDWIAGTKRCADAFVKLWNTYGQFGQFVDTETGEIIVGGSASGAIAAAGLALASQFFKDTTYLKIAERSAEYYYHHFTQLGYSTGGPGEICQCPDSESAFAILEAFVVLYEVTGDLNWIEKAKEQANQCMTWCVSYDFEFPPASTFGKLEMKATGSVYANVQNKHSSPGICTLSGDALFKLYRATQDVKYLELIKEIAHNLTQYLSRSDRPITAKVGYWPGKKSDSDSTYMPSGWMCERVEMSDWLEPIGEIFYGSCWCEISNMLTFVEVPGLYVQTDTGFVCAIDHITAEVVENTEQVLKLMIHNPTQYKADVKVFCESSIDLTKPLGQNALKQCEVLHIEPISTVEFSYNKL
ncbi:MAG: hypothetical protein H7X94_02520 [Vallitaleaceae bacterium]|nr:hypothetical protein [Vallitaleaceae bacterium]